MATRKKKNKGLDLESVKFPIIKEFSGVKTIATELVSVKPMAVPTGTFHFIPTYSSTFHNEEPIKYIPTEIESIEQKIKEEIWGNPKEPKPGDQLRFDMHAFHSIDAVAELEKMLLEEINKAIKKEP